MNVSELLPFRARRRGMTTAQKAALGGAIALVAAPAIRILAANLRKRRLNGDQARAESEAAIDKGLKDTYPASDPPASHYFDIPVNRQ